MLIDKLRTRGVALSLAPDGNLHVQADRPPTDELRDWIRSHKPELVNELRYLGHDAEADLDEAREERQAIMEESGEPADVIEATVAKIAHVACIDCAHDKPDGGRCGAGLVRADRHATDRICGRFTRPTGAGV